MAISVERVDIAVTVTDPGDAQTPAWRDTLYLTVPGTSLTATQLKALRDQAVTDATARHIAWLSAIRNPAPPVDPVPVSKDEALVAAHDALVDALAAVDAATGV